MVDSVKIIQEACFQLIGVTKEIIALGVEVDRKQNHEHAELSNYPNR